MQKVQHDFDVHNILPKFSIIHTFNRSYVVVTHFYVIKRIPIRSKRSIRSNVLFCCCLKTFIRSYITIIIIFCLLSVPTKNL